MTIYSLDVLLFLFGTSLLFHVHFKLLLPGLHTHFSRGRSGGLVLPSLSEFSTVYCDPHSQWFWHSQKSRNRCFPRISCFFDDSVGVGNLISGSSVFSKTSLNVREFTVHVLLKPGLEDFEDYFTSMWDECNCVAIGRQWQHISSQEVLPTSKVRVVADRSYPTSKVRSNSCALLEQRWRDNPCPK